MVKVSVIVPVYKVEAYIKRCARSLFEQTLDDMEYIFVNDCTPDNSLKVLKNVLSQYPQREKQVQIVSHKERKGSSCARNTGLAIASGKYIIYCDSDDYVDIRMYESMYETAVATDADIVWCDFYDVYPDRVFYHKTADTKKNHIEFLREYMSSWTSVCNMLVKKNLYLEHDLRFPENIMHREDFYMSVILHFYASKVKKINKALYYYNRSNPGSILSSANGNTLNEVLFCDLSIIEFFKEKNIFSSFEKEMAWGVLRDKSDLILNPKTYRKFLSIYPESHQYIWSCPLLNFKIKCIMWLVVNHLSVVASIINLIRGLLNRK